MTVSTNDYLATSIIQNDPWVKKIVASTEPEELANLIMKRILDSANNGPTAAYPSPNKELPATLICDLATESLIDYDLINNAMAIIMNKIVKKEIQDTNDVMENVFYIIQQLTVGDVSSDLFTWIKNNSEKMNSKDNNKAIYYNAVIALAYSHEPELEGVKDFWDKLWNHDDRFWWSPAFLGIRYCDFDKAISLVPELIGRKCSNTPFLLKSLWRVLDDTRFADALKKGIRENASWAGLAVNLLASKMKFAEQSKLIDRLYDKEYSSENEEDDEEAYDRWANLGG